MKYASCAVILFLALANSAVADELSGKTIRIIYTNGATENVFVGPDKIFLSGSGNSLGGNVCGLGTPFSETLQCDNANVASCGGAFRSMASKDNLSTTIVNSCEATLSGSKLCWRSTNRQAYKMKSISGEATTADEICVVIDETDRCSASGTRITTGSVNYSSSYRSSKCTVISGRHL